MVPRKIELYKVQGNGGMYVVMTRLLMNESFQLQAIMLQTNTKLVQFSTKQHARTLTINNWNSSRRRRKEGVQIENKNEKQRWFFQIVYFVIGCNIS